MTRKKRKTRKRLSDADRQALEDMKYWQSYERGGWKCLGFTFRECATFFKGMRSIEVNSGHLQFFGVWRGGN